MKLPANSPNFFVRNIVQGPIGRTMKRGAEVASRVSDNVSLGISLASDSVTSNIDSIRQMSTGKKFALASAAVLSAAMIASAMTPAPTVPFELMRNDNGAVVMAIQDSSTAVIPGQVQLGSDVDSFLQRGVSTNDGSGTLTVCEQAQQLGGTCHSADSVSIYSEGGKVSINKTADGVYRVSSPDSHFTLSDHGNQVHLDQMGSNGPQRFIIPTFN